MADSWSSVVESSVTQYPLRRYGAVSVLQKAEGREPLIVAGYSSPQIVDREKHVITKEALARDLPRFMAHPHYRNVNLLHCLEAGTPIKVGGNGVSGSTFTRIEVIKVGDRVLTHKGRLMPVTHVFKHKGPNEVVELRLGNGETVHITDEHQVLVVGKGWTRAGDLVAGDMLHHLVKKGHRSWELADQHPRNYLFKGDSSHITERTREASNARRNEEAREVVTNGVEVLSAEKIPFDGWVYNLEVEDDHSYAGKGVIYHNSNVQVGEVIPSWTNPRTGERYETKVDEVGLFTVVRVRTDAARPPIVDKVIDDIESGKLAAFSISADAPFESRRHECAGGTCFWVIDEIVLYEVTLCFKGNEPVWTKSGLKKIKDVMTGDLVWTHKNRWRPVVRTMQREVDEDLVRITTERGIISPTGEHPFRVMRYRGRGEGSKYEWVPAKDLVVGDLISYHEPSRLCEACGAPMFSSKPTKKFCDIQCKAKVPNRRGKTVASGDPGAISHAAKVRGLRHPGKGGIKTEAGRAVQRASVKTDGFRAKRRAITSAQWRDPAYVARQMAVRNVGQNKLEKVFEPLARTYGFRFVGDGQLVIGGRGPDFWDGGTKLIELYGDYFHSGQDPQNRLDHFAKHGYETLVLWESEVNGLDVAPIVEEFAGNALVRVTTIGTEPYKGTVYNLEVEEDNSYTMKEGVVHNCESPVNQDAKFTVISKSFDEAGEFAASAWCGDGRCPVTPAQAAMVLKGYRSESGRMLFEGVADEAAGPKGLESSGPEATPPSPANRLVPEPTTPKFAKFLKGLRGMVDPRVQAMIDREFGSIAKDAPGPVGGGVRAAGLAVVAGDTGRVLMLQRAAEGDDPAGGTWEFPGGRLEPGESPLGAAKREWAEEVGRPLPEGGLASQWESPDGVYAGFVWRIDGEDLLPLGERDEMINPDDPDGDQFEALAWWEPDHIGDNPALREELKDQAGDIEKLARQATSAVGKSRDGVDEFDEGLETESAEHYESVGGDVGSIANIVRDHLAEDPRYYSKVLAEEGGEEGKLDPASAAKLERARAGVETPGAREMAERYGPRPTYGVAPDAPLADPDGERQYLNLSDVWASHGGFRLVQGDEEKVQPVTQGKVKTPKLAAPDNSYVPMVIKEVLAAVEAAVDSVRLDKGLEGDARAAAAAIRFGSPSLTWIPGQRSDFVLWTDGTAFGPDRAYVRLGRLLKGLRDAATRAGAGEALNAAGVAQERLRKSVPLTAGQAAGKAAAIVRAATLAPGLPPSALSGLAKAWDSTVRGDPAAALDGVRKQLEAAVGDGGGNLDPTVMAALGSLYEDAESVIEGMALGQYVRMGEEPEHGIIKEAGAGSTYKDVAKTDAALGRVSKGGADDFHRGLRGDLGQSEKSDTIRGPEDLDGLSNKGGPENLPEGFKERHLEAEGPHPGAMVAWFPESGLARQLATDGGEDADELHVTIAYLTDDAANDLGDDGVERALGVLRHCALEQRPMDGSIGGLGRFSPGDDGRVPLVALVDVPGLSEFRAKLVGALREVGVPVDGRHGFTPHMTLRYDPAGMDDLERRGIPVTETSPIAIDRLWLVSAGERFEVSLDRGVGQVSGAEPEQFRKGGPAKSAAPAREAGGRTTVGPG
jgi:8-oxo-dGTP pyrophosphatase MutT (NUDIX family)/intein/homing endonuclease/2'-5' RNA ligase